MPLQPQNIPITFRQGEDTKTDPRQVILGKFLTLQNAIFIARQKLTKRNGYTGLSQNIEGGTSIATGQGLHTFKNELLEFTGTQSYSYSQATNKWSSKGALASLELTPFPVIRNSYQQTTPDSAYHASGLQVFTWEDSRGGSRYSVVDSTTGQFILQDVLLVSTAVKPKPFALGNYLVILYFDTSVNHLRYLPISVVTPSSALTLTDLATDINVSNYNFDAVLFLNQLYITYNNTTGGGGISVKTLNQYLVQSSSLNVTGEAASVCINITADTTFNQIWVSYYNGTAVKCFVRNSGLTSAAILAPTVVETVASVRNIAAAASNGLGTFFYEITGSQTYNNLIRTNTTNKAGTVGTAAIFLRSVGLASKLFTVGGVNYLTVAYSSPLQPTYFVVNTSKNIVAKFSPSLGGGLTAKSILPEAVATLTSQVQIAALQKDLLTTIGVTTGKVFTQTGLTSYTFNFASQNTYFKSEIGQNLHISGAVLSMYDGASVVEHGFHLYPEPVTLTPSNTGGSLGNASVATQYQVSVCYEWIDNQGQTHRSAPSIPATVNFSSGIVAGSIAVTIPTLRLTAKSGTRTPVMCVTYCTLGTGTIFYQDSNPVSPTLNDTTADTVSYTVTASDTTRQGNPQLYTTGAVVSNISAPASSFITSFKDRIILIPSEAKQSFWFSKQVIPGSPVEFSDLLTQNIDGRGGDLTAAAQMDSSLILFKNTLPFIMGGTGPDSTGAQNDFTEAQAIAIDAGCTNARSLVMTQAGLMFDSLKGKYLLTRSLGELYIGADIETYNGIPVTAVQLIPNSKQVRFCLNNAIALVYHYDDHVLDQTGKGQWSVFTNHAAVDATIFQNQFTYLTSAGLVMQETPGLFTDNGAFVPLGGTLGWISPAGLDGYARTRGIAILGDFKSAHTLLVQIAYDFNSVSVQQDYIPATSLCQGSAYGTDVTYGVQTPYGGNYMPYEFQISFARQKCTSFQISFQDVQSSNFGEGFQLSSFTLQIAAKSGFNRIANTRTFG